MKLKSFIIFLSTLFLGLNWAYAAYSENVPAAQQTEQTIAEKMMNMTAREYGEWRGKKLNFFERRAFRFAQHQMESSATQSKGFNVLGFLLGWVLLPIGVLGAYIFSKDRNLRKWAWVGFGLGFLASVLVIALAFHTL